MRKILLHGSSHRNSGDYVDAGETVDVGGGPADIEAKRAQTLVDNDQAREVGGAQAQKSQRG